MFIPKIEMIFKFKEWVLTKTMFETKGKEVDVDFIKVLRSPDDVNMYLTVKKTGLMGLRRGWQMRSQANSKG